MSQYSGNGGASFQVQSAPIVAGYFYQLSSVFVIKGTIAFAAGGNPYGTEGSSSGILASTTATVSTASSGLISANGIIIATVNGGFTWVVQVCFPPLTCSTEAKFISFNACLCCRPWRAVTSTPAPLLT